MSAVEYQKALACMPRVYDALADIFTRCDAILTPAASGAAPRGLASTGDPAFCTLWTYCGMPALNLPLLTTSDGLPLGMQLVGARLDDARLLRTARWLLARIASAQPTGA
jgi:Asp-tRNA(Asn)/Glu-tRNA(Gln) amidotransferase A subunit family amidase